MVTRVKPLPPEPWRSSTEAAEDAEAITPSDSDVLSVATRAVWVGGGTGTVKVRMLSGRDCTFTGASGALLPIKVDMVYSTGTDASGIVALY